MVQAVSNKHSRIAERHIAVDVLASFIGADVFYAVVNKSLWAGLSAVVLAGVLYVVDRIGIENEESNGR